jgi:hypothetical protein
MSASGSRMILTLGFLALMIYVVLLILAWRKKWTFRFMGILFVPLIFVSFKHGFVRQDTHVMFFILFFLPAIGLLILTSIGQKEIKISVTAFVAMLILSLPALVSFNSLPTLSETKAIFSGESGKSFINSIIHLKETQGELDYYSKLDLEKDRLPAQWLGEIGNATVDTIPWEICYCPANNLNWSPNPVLQIYSAYTSSLDLKSASHYDGVGAPHFLIAEFIDIDGRHPLLAEPATWHRIISNYDVIFLDLEANRFLLKKKVQHLEEKIATFSQGKGYINQWISVPDSNKFLFVSIKMKQNIRGVALEALFRIPPVYIDLIFKSGRIASYRIIPDTAKNGVLINYIPYDIEELMKLFKGVSNDRVTKFKISGPGTLCYSKDCDIRWSDIN